MNSFRDIDVAVAYDSGRDGVNVVSEFFLPILSKSVSYNRLSGYFSSQVLALAARGIAGLISNNGRMRLITSLDLQPADIEVLQNTPSVTIEEEQIVRAFEKALGNLDELSDLFVRNHLKALAWMLSRELLEIRVINPRKLSNSPGIFHQKVGIFTDGLGDQISFSGSVNETAYGWTQNIEEFKVFKSWEPSESRYLKHDQDMFDRYWELGEMPGSGVFKLPEGAKRVLTTQAPEELSELDLSQLIDLQKQVAPSRLRAYQHEAVQSWIRADRRGILEMATGTGKTITASYCIRDFIESSSEPIVVVTCPSQSIAAQWEKVLAEWSPIVAGKDPKWRDNFANRVSEMRFGTQKSAMLVVIQNTASRRSFQELLNSFITGAGDALLVADEMHGLGSQIFRQALNSGFSSRLGLSATPARWMDDDGTDLLLDYFGGVVFKFGIHEALAWIDPNTGQAALCPYEYWPVFVDLSRHEVSEYLKLTGEINQLRSRLGDDGANESEKLKMLYFQRADILKSAESKLPALRKILSGIENISGCLIYCSDFEQLESVKKLVDEIGLKFAVFTGDEDSRPQREYGGLSERDWILNDFTKGNVQVLIAIKCLDEGVDIPSARLGVILASTTNPREFIQRRGRLIRNEVGKNNATIFDLVVSPDLDSWGSAPATKVARRLFSKELLRIREFAEDAMNADEIEGRILSEVLKLEVGH